MHTFTLPRWFLPYYAALFGLLATTGMHIPDGYLSPATNIIMFILVLPFWAIGIRQLRGKANARSIPLVALMAAFTFVIMMFNIPLPGGTTGHAVGAAIAAIFLGPGIATITVSTALIIQAFVFGDGGILAIGANCFTMAVVMPYVSYAVYQWIAHDSPLAAPRRLIAVGCAGYAGLTASALVTAVLFGIQPALFSDARGVPLYAPYPLGIALPAVLIPHLLVASPIEAFISAAILAFVRRTRPQAFEALGSGLTRVHTRWTPLWVVLGGLVALAPLGLLAPGTAWGEWSAGELGNLGLGFIPAGLQKLGSIWGAPVPDYAVTALGNIHLSYLLSAILGVALTMLVTWLFTRLLVPGDIVDEKRPG